MTECSFNAFTFLCFVSDGLVISGSQDDQTEQTSILRSYPTI